MTAANPLRHALASVALIAACAGCAPRPEQQNPSTQQPIGECRSDTECIAGACLALLDEEPHCYATCGPDGTCASNHTCSSVGDERVCLALIDTRAPGEPCEGSRECASGVCAAVEGRDGGAVCMVSCDEGQSCPAGSRCVVDPAVFGGPMCAVATDDRDDGEPCTNARECLGGRCIPWQGSMTCGSPCEGGCGDGGVCGSRVPFGQACLPILDNGDVCLRHDECTNSRCIASADAGVCVGPCGADRSCPAGTGCAADTEGAGSCVPLVEQRGDGESCTTPLQCRSGRCATFAFEGFDGGQECASPCDGGACAEGELCWGRDVDAGARGLCGPDPY